MALTTEERKAMQKKNDELFKKYKPRTLRFPGGSSITMDNKDGLIRECKRLGVEYYEDGPKPKDEIPDGVIDTTADQEDKVKTADATGTTEGTSEESTTDSTEEKKTVRRGRPKKT